MKRFNPIAPPPPPSAAPLTQPRKAPQPPGATSFTVTLSENHHKDGLELRFPCKPSVEILDSLKAAGWRWSRFNSCWYHRNTPENRTFANRFLISEPSGRVSPSAPPPPESPVANVVHVAFGSPETAFDVNPKPVPAWKRALLRRS